MTKKNQHFPAPVVGQYYEWKGPRNTFYMGKCTMSLGHVAQFDDGPDMLDDGRYKATSPARAVAVPVYRIPQEVQA